MSKIEWTEKTWNPITGCTKISDGCKNCYAEKMAYRLQAMGQKNYKNGFKPTLQPHMLDAPFKWKKPSMVFVCSMSDLFHESISLEYIEEVLDAIEVTDWHTYQILTKRSLRLKNSYPFFASHFPENAWFGVSVESDKYKYRIDDLRSIGASVKFVSLEPLLGPVDVDLSGIDWVIVGGESGPCARPMKKEWVIDIRNRCVDACVPFFFKQWGGVNKKKNGRLLNGKIWDQMPRIRR